MCVGILGDQRYKLPSNVKRRRKRHKVHDLRKQNGHREDRELLGIFETEVIHVGPRDLQLKGHGDCPFPSRLWRFRKFLGKYKRPLWKSRRHLL